MGVSSQNIALEEILLAVRGVKGQEYEKMLAEVESEVQKLHENRIQEEIESVSYNTPTCGDVTVNYVPIDYHRIDDSSYGMKFETNFWPQNVQIEKVPNYVLGQGVLGRAFTTLGVIQIDERLNGEAFYEVLMHEMEHMMYPDLSEGEVRLRTKYKLPFKPIFH